MKSGCKLGRDDPPGKSSRDDPPGRLYLRVNRQQIKREIRQCAGCGVSSTCGLLPIPNSRFPILP
ncbi:hypothetical protein NIES3974_19590 [Calothrix sp. NIES-3974]|nr:hypothetical protein NIES3974_19590 [Calothrix sp. NIES-3974]